MANDISYQEVASAIAAILTIHPQFDKVFTEFENCPWMPLHNGMIKRIPNGGVMIATRGVKGKVKITFRADVNVRDL